MRLFLFLIALSLAGCGSHQTAPPAQGRVRVRPPGMTWRLTSSRGISSPGRTAAVDAGFTPGRATAAMPPKPAVGGINGGGHGI